MTLRFIIILSFSLLVSCNTIATKKRARPAYKVSSQVAQNVTGMSTSKPGAPTEATTSKEPQLINGLDYLKLLLEKNKVQPNEELRVQAIDIVENKLNDDQLEAVAKDAQYDFLRPHATFKLGEIALEHNDISRAQKLFQYTYDNWPQSDLALRSQDILTHMSASRNVRSETVGVVLPLSGRSANVGQRALRGLEIGLGLHIPGSKFNLAVMDSEGNPDLARRGVERLVKEDNVIAVVGSLLSKTAPAVASKSDELGVPSIGLSQRSGLTDIGSNVFRNSLTSTMQVKALVRTAMDNMGLKKFAILYPNDPYGVEFANIFWDEVLARGGQVTAVQTYSVKETDFRLVIQRLTGTYFGEARKDEFDLRLREMQSSDKRKSVRSDKMQNVLPPVVDFDAIFIPDSVKAMGQISAMLSFSDVKNVKLLGTNLWNTKDVSKRAGHFVNDLLFVDSTYPQLLERSRFVAEYRNLYNEEPSLIELQAYDSGLILRQLIAGGATSRERLRDALARVKQLPGSIGSLSINEDREIERPVTALTVQKGQTVPFSK